MKQWKMMFAVLIMAILFVGNSYAQQKFLVADGSSSGTYKQFLKEMIPVFEGAGVNLDFQEVDSTGAIDNLDKLVNNDVMAAFMHADVIYHRSKNDSASKLEERYQTLLTLFPEDVQFITLSKPKKVGGIAGIGYKTITMNSISDLAGMKVGAAGGGYITSSIVKLMSDIPYEVVKYNSGKEVLAALDNGEVDAVEFTGAAPLPNLKDLGPDYKVLSVPDNIIDKLKTIYQPSQITYTKMSAQPIRTVAVPCLLVARVYKTPKLVAALKSMRSTFFKKLTELQETPGNHKKWQDVDPTNHGPWVWMELGK